MLACCCARGRRFVSREKRVNQLHPIRDGADDFCIAFRHHPGTCATRDGKTLGGPGPTISFASSEQIPIAEPPQNAGETALSHRAKAVPTYNHSPIIFNPRPAQQPPMDHDISSKADAALDRGQHAALLCRNPCKRGAGGHAYHSERGRSVSRISRCRTPRTVPVLRLRPGKL